jgi:hypothetical protein
LIAKVGSSLIAYIKTGLIAYAVSAVGRRKRDRTRGVGHGGAQWRDFRRVWCF